MVRSDSGINSLKDLKGKSFAFVDPASTSGHLYPKTLLFSKGLDPKTFFGKSVFAGSHNAVVFSIYKGEVDGGAAYDGSRAAVAKSYPDIFEKITLYENKVKLANAFENPDGTYSLDLEVEAKKVYSDSLGVQTSAELADWLEIGVLGEDIIYGEKQEVPIYIEKVFSYPLAYKLH